MSKHYPLATSSWADEELDAIKRLLSQDQFTMGSYVKKFEDEFSEYIGSNYSVIQVPQQTYLLLLHYFIRKIIL
jgi:CDP-6-deoxy-D-xylo-4-hexulose-3-dehydrase